MKKIIVLAGIVMLLLLPATGCGGAASDQGDAAAPEEQVAQTEQAEQPESGNLEEPAVIDESYIKKILEKGAAAAVEGISYDMTSSSGDVSYSASFYCEGDMLKMISSAEGMDSVMISDGKTTVMYNPADKTGMKYPIAEEDGTTPDANPSDLLSDMSFSYVGKETLGDQDCIVVTGTSKTDNTSMKYWLSKRYGMPIKMEGSSLDGQVYTMEINNISIGKLPDGTFDVPADITIQEISQ